MKCPFCNSKNQKPQELCLNCGRVLSYKNFEPSITDKKNRLVIKEYIPQRKNLSLPLGMITIGVAILMFFLFKTRPTGFFSNHNPFLTSEQIKEYESNFRDFYFLGWKNRKKNQFDKATDFFEKSIESSPLRRAESYYHLGLISIKKKDFKRGKFFLKKAVELSPRFINPRLILEGIDSKNRFINDFKNKSAKLCEFSRIWQITKLYTRVWVLVRIEAVEDHSIFTVRIPATYAPNRHDDIMVYGDVGRFDLRTYDEKITGNLNNKKILRNALIQFQFFKKGYHDFLFTVQAPFYEGVNPMGEVNLTIKPIERAVWNEFFALPASNDKSSVNKWNLKGFGGIKRPLEIFFEVDNKNNFLEPFNGFESIGFSKTIQ